MRDSPLADPFKFYGCHVVCVTLFSCLFLFINRVLKIHFEDKRIRINFANKYVLRQIFLVF